MVKHENIVKYGVSNELLLKYPILWEFSNIKKYNKKEVIYREGSEGNYIYILLKGVLITYRINSKGQQRLFKFIKPNEIYGNIILNSDFNHIMTVEALEPVVNLEISRHYLEQIVLKHPDILLFLYKDISQKFSERTIWFDNNFLTAEGRILKCIISLAQQFGYKTKEGIKLNINITQDDLARYSHTNRVTVAKLQHKLNSLGIIRTKPKPWLILQIDELVKILSDLELDYNV
ncbi:Crp/Fnr family transcriptional regulator [Selenomonadales bacterium OttesenSCG-928-I06]|nr:Crp/Fnr family transcriptional regulator [Selenomonadales bacterium OttesenSCG-928-I06]